MFYVMFIAVGDDRRPPPWWRIADVDVWASRVGQTGQPTPQVVCGPQRRKRRKRRGCRVFLL
jgi:hypothetical protein